MLESTLRRLIFAKMATAKALVEATATGNPLTFLTDKAKPLRSLLIPFTPTQTGTGDPSPDNVRPIVGITGLTAWRTGKNMLKVSAESYYNSQMCSYELTETGIKVTATNTYARRLDVFRVVPGAKYTLSFKCVSTGDYNNIYIQSAASWLTTDGYTIKVANGTLKEYTYTFTAQTDVLGLGWYVTANAASGTMEISDLQLELADTATPYAPYTGESFHVDWTDEAGTVYGGTLDVLTGLLTVKYKRESFDNLNFKKSSASSIVGGNVFTVGINEIGDGMAARVRYAPNTMLCDAFVACEASVWFINTMPDNSMMSNETNFYIAASGYETADEFKEGLAGKYLVYELATPQTIQLDPVTVNALVGDNTVWSDTNGSNTAVYLKKA